MTPRFAAAASTATVGVLLGCIDLSAIRPLSPEDGGVPDAAAANDGAHGDAETAPTDAHDAGSLPAPRLVAPLSGATVTSRKPTLRWLLADGTDGAHVQICGDRACVHELSSFDAQGTTGQPAADLPTGVVYWRASSRSGSATGALRTPTWELIVGARSAPVDSSWGAMLDVDGDGLADLVIGASNGGDGSTGRATVVTKGADPSTLTLVGPDGLGSRFGCSVASAGDVNGDGFSDIVVGACGGNSAYAYLGSANGIVTVPAATLFENVNGFASSIAGPGDVNGDGYADVVVGASDGARVYLGSASGLSSVPAVKLALSGGLVAGAGDVNGDGYADIVSCGSGSINVYLGGPSSPGFAPSTTLADPADGPAATCLSVAGAGDVNGDGYADIIVEAVKNSSGAAHADVYLGSAAGPGSAPFVSLATPPGSASAAAAGAGDVNGDGYADVLVQTALPGDTFSGEAYLYLGGAGGPSSAPASATPAGAAVVGAGDVDGDGFADVAAAYAGQLVVYLGTKDGLLSSHVLSTLNLAFGQRPLPAGDLNGDGCADVVATNDAGQYVYYPGGPFGLGPLPAAVLGPGGFSNTIANAGDVNHDGYSDLLVTGGAVESVDMYLGSQTGPASAPSATLTSPEMTDDGFGESFAVVGDVNHDGYADVVVGASRGGANSAGRVHLYLGGPTGLPALPSATLATPDGGSGFGLAVAGAGDVNRDGYADVVIDEGSSVLLYLGSAQGLSPAPVSMLPTPADFLPIVGGAGDVNGDGYDDVLVGGATSVDIYLGSAAGLAASPAGTLVAPDGATSAFGDWISVGDLNKDGYGDVIVGGWATSGGFRRGFVFLGGPAGLSPSPATVIVTPDDSRYRASFVSQLGDVDCDGRADVLVGSFTGQFQVYAGASSGVASVPLSTLTDPAIPTDAYGCSLQ